MSEIRVTPAAADSVARSLQSVTETSALVRKGSAPARVVPIEEAGSEFVRITPGVAPALATVLARTGGKSADVVQVGVRRVEVSVGDEAFACTNRGQVEPVA